MNLSIPTLPADVTAFGSATPGTAGPALASLLGSLPPPAFAPGATPTPAAANLLPPAPDFAALLSGGTVAALTSTPGLASTPSDLLKLPANLSRAPAEPLPLAELPVAPAVCVTSPASALGSIETPSAANPSVDDSLGETIPALPPRSEAVRFPALAHDESPVIAPDASSSDEAAPAENPAPDSSTSAPAPSLGLASRHAGASAVATRRAPIAREEPADSSVATVTPARPISQSSDGVAVVAITSPSVSIPLPSAKEPPVAAAESDGEDFVSIGWGSTSSKSPRFSRRPAAEAEGTVSPGVTANVQSSLPVSPASMARDDSAPQSMLAPTSSPLPTVVVAREPQSQSIPFQSFAPDRNAAVRASATSAQIPGKALAVGSENESSVAPSEIPVIAPRRADPGIAPRVAQDTDSGTTADAEPNLGPRSMSAPRSSASAPVVSSGNVRSLGGDLRQMAAAVSATISEPAAVEERVVVRDSVPPVSNALVRDLPLSSRSLVQSRDFSPADFSSPESQVPSATPVVSAAPLATSADRGPAVIAAVPAPRVVATDSRAENFSVATEPVTERVQLAAEPVQKKIVTSFERVVKTKSAAAGTDVAINSDTMPAAFAQTRSIVETVAAAPLAARSDETANRTPEKIETARTVVENVLNVIDVQDSAAARTRSSVNLHFTVGGEALAVRVELRAGEIHAQFRSESPELNAALAQEWRTVSTGAAAGDHGLRLANPVFVAAPPATSTANANGFSSSLGDGAPRQQQPQVRESFFPGQLLSARGAPAASPTEDASPAPRALPAHSRLHTFA